VLVWEVGKKGTHDWTRFILLFALLCISLGTGIADILGKGEKAEADKQEIIESTTKKVGDQTARTVDSS